MRFLAQLIAAACVVAASAASAQTPELFRGADLQLGDKLQRDHYRFGLGAAAAARPASGR